jgi:hypothetical protein
VGGAIEAGMTEVLILIAVVTLLTLALGLPLLLKPDSLIPDLIVFVLLAAYVAFAIWASGAWWVLLPILALAAWVVRFDDAGPAAPADPFLDARGMSARTRLRFRLWRIAKLAILVPIAAFFFLPPGNASTILACMTVALVAAQLFRFSFYRAWQRDHEDRAEMSSARASPAASG